MLSLPRGLAARESCDSVDHIPTMWADCRVSSQKIQERFGHRLSERKSHGAPFLQSGALKFFTAVPHWSVPMLLKH